MRASSVAAAETKRGSRCPDSESFNCWEIEKELERKGDKYKHRELFKTTIILIYIIDLILIRNCIDILSDSNWE